MMVNHVTLHDVRRVNSLLVDIITSLIRMPPQADGLIKVITITDVTYVTLEE